MAKTVEQLKAEKAAIERKLRQRASKEADIKRKALSQKKIVIGGTVLALLESGALRLAVPDPKEAGRWCFASAGGRADDLRAVLDLALKRPADRAAVGLDPLP